MLVPVQLYNLVKLRWQEFEYHFSGISPLLCFFAECLPSRNSTFFVDGTLLPGGLERKFTLANSGDTANNGRRRRPRNETLYAER